MKIAGLMVTRNYNPSFMTFQVLRRMVDFTAVLDDGSTQPFPFQAECDEYIFLKRSGAWHDTGNRLMLLMRAYLHECPWAVVTGGDILPSVKFYHGVKSLSGVPSALYGGVYDGLHPDIVMVPLRELWGDIYHYRVDGLWGDKVVAGLTRCWTQTEAVRLPCPAVCLHGYASAVDTPVRGCAPDGFAAYHFGSITAEQRKARVQKYAEEDPRNLHQADYTYLVDERGVKLAETPPEDAAFLKRVLCGDIPAVCADTSNTDDY